MTNKIISIKLIGDNNYIDFQFDDGENMVGEINEIIEESGITLENIEYPISAYYIHLESNFGKTLKCGNIISTFFTALKSRVNNSIIVVDFDNIEEVSENFCAQYYKYILNTNNKIITINQNIDVSNIVANFILLNIDILEM